MTSDFSQRKTAVEYKMVKEGNGVQWLALFILGDESIFREVYDANKMALYSFALKLLDYQITDAEDITALAFARLWEKRATIKSPSHIRPWLFTVARNAILNQKGRNWKKKVFDLIRLTETSSEDAGWDLEIVHAEVIDLITKEFKELPDGVREVFTLSFFEKKNGQEIALALRMSESKVSRYKKLAYRLLRTAILKEGLFPPSFS